MTKRTLGWHIKRIEIMLEGLHKTKYWDTYGVDERGDREFALYMKAVDKEAEKK